MNAQTYRAQINAAIKPFGVKVVAGRGYSYFLDLKSGHQIGESIFVFRQSDQTIERWVSDAKAAREAYDKENAQHIARQSALDKLTLRTAVGQKCADDLGAALTQYREAFGDTATKDFIRGFMGCTIY